MKILIVEDDENKGGQVEKFVRGTFPQFEVELERSFQSGLRSVRRERPSLILLDMTLPTYDVGPEEQGGQPQILGGREFLLQMDRFDIEVPVIVVTQFEIFGKPPQAMHLSDLDQLLRTEHPKIYRGAVYYHAAIDGWKGQLKSMVEQSCIPGAGLAGC